MKCCKKFESAALCEPNVLECIYVCVKTVLAVNAVMQIFTMV
jgi:hypothetical protein